METLFGVCGLVGALLFFGRFYVQWAISEIRKEYTIPVSFWYMSAAGSLMLFVYAYGQGSPGGTFSLCFNLLVYGRNLIYVWRDRGTLTAFRSAITHATVGIAVVVAGILTYVTWRGGYRNTTEFWVWSAIWAAGQGVFFLRFIIQWAITEMKRKSVVPAVFWQLSIVGLFLHGAYYFHRADWVLAFGTVADGLPYVRNLWLMRHCPAAEES